MIMRGCDGGLPGTKHNEYSVTRRQEQLPEDLWSFGPPVPQLSLWKRQLSPCHPDRSVANWRDLRFGGPFLDMFFDSAI
jgi:hypothetical protein